MEDYPPPLLNLNFLHCEESFPSSSKLQTSPSAALFCTESFDLDQEMEVLPELHCAQLSPLNSDFSTFLDHLQQKEQIFCPLFQSLRDPPNVVKPYMRAFLINNMQNICSLFESPRESFHRAVNFIDRVIAKDVLMTRDNFQLYGIVAVYLARQSIDNSDLRPSSLLATSENLFSLEDFRTVMLRFCKLLQWRLNSVTPFDILMNTLTEWDRFVGVNYRKIVEDNAKLALVNGLGFEDSVDYWLITFMKGGMRAEGRVLRVLNMMDVSALSVGSYKFLPSYLVAGILYVMVTALVEESGFGMLGFNGRVHELTVESEEMLKGHLSEMVLHFLVTVLKISAVEMVEQVVGFVAQFLQCPEPDLGANSYSLFEPVEKLQRQLYNQFSFHWISQSNLY